MNFAGYQFKTKTEVISYLSDVLRSYKSGDVLSGKPFNIADGVFRLHPRYKEKTKGRSYKIEIAECHVNKKNNKFMVAYCDGEFSDFSFHKALSYPSIETRVKAALRRHVDYQTIKYKEDYFASNKDSKGFILCQATNLKIKIKECHLDHYPMQFEEIVFNWISNSSLDFHDIELVYYGDDCETLILKDECLIQSFADYHKEVASYRLVLAKVNLQREKFKKPREISRTIHD